MFLCDILEVMDSPKPHFNMISTVVRAYKKRKFVIHSFGNTHRCEVSVS